MGHSAVGLDIIISENEMENTLETEAFLVDFRM